MMTIKKLAMQLCLSSAVIAAMPAFAAEVAPTTQHYMVKNLNIGDTCQNYCTHYCKNG